jgi:hypothetical protein
LDETELSTVPVLMIQIWDNDKFSADDFLGKYTTVVFFLVKVLYEVRTPLEQVKCPSVRSPRLRVQIAL